MNNHLLIFGFGFTSEAVAEKLKSSFSTISGTTRSEDKSKILRSRDITPILFDGEKISEELSSTLETATHLLISIGPNDAGDPVLNAAAKRLKKCKNLQWIGYLSTVGVYGNHDGAWVDETTTCKPVSKRSIQRLGAEKAWLDFGRELNIPTAIFRLAGIYGPGRNAFMNIEKGNARRLVKPGQVFNRIHREDIASAVALAVEKSAHGIFNITDDLPAPPQDVVAYAHKLADLEPPEEIDFETADLAPMARSFYGENKRVSNAKSKSVLGLEYAWPNYHQSLNRMWEKNVWKR